MTPQIGLIGGHPVRPNSRFVLVVFWITVLFQLTELKHIWGLEGVARFANLSALVLMSAVALGSLSGNFEAAVWGSYVVPGLLLFLGLAANFTRNMFVTAGAGDYFGQLLPWATYLAIPLLVKRRSLDERLLWRYFYFVMLASVAIGLVEYFAAFADLTSFRTASLPNGVYLLGRFSLLYASQNGELSSRFYACFSEPGNLAMLLLPAMAYAVCNARWLGLGILLVGFSLTQSLGGWISLCILGVALTQMTLSWRRFRIGATLVATLAAMSIWYLFSANLMTQYEERGDSRAEREANLVSFVVDLPSHIALYPVGGVLGTPGDREVRPTFGTTFTIGNMLWFGGVPAMLGYIACLAVTIAAAVAAAGKGNLTVHERVAWSSILALAPFVVQRTTIWDSPMFGFLFAPLIIRWLSERRIAPDRFRRVSLRKS